MRGYFAIGIVGASKAGNMGNLIRTAHGFGAAFVFSIRSKYEKSLVKIRTDTSKTANAVPFYEYNDLDDLTLPKGCQMVGVELADEAVDLPSFRHPNNAAYILGSERYSLPEEILTQCGHVIKIPTKFSLNVATAGAIVMYDRLRCLGKFAERPVTPSGDPIEPPLHVRGEPHIRSVKRDQKTE